MKQTLNNVKELVTPLLKVGIKRCISLFRKMKKDEYDESQTSWQRDQKLVPEGEFGLFEEYLELGISYDTVTTALLHVKSIYPSIIVQATSSFVKLLPSELWSVF